MHGAKELKKLASLLILLLVTGCSPAVPRNIPPPPGNATHQAATSTALPTLTALPTDPIWTGWNPLGVNLALKKHVRVSSETYGFGGAAAVDGNLRTRWDSGARPTQWIEIDLGEPHDISGIRLLPAHTKPGVTVHHVLGKGPFTSGYEELYTFESQVSDSPLLAQPPTGPWRNIQFIRIETTFSPGPVGWAEIQVIAAEEGK